MVTYTDIKILRRRGTAAAWTSANPTLSAGQFGYETDTRQMKVGDGVTAWNSLPYFPSQTDIDALTEETDPTLGQFLALGNDKKYALDKLSTKALIVAVSDETTALTTGTAKRTFRWPFAFELTDIKASVTTAPTGASLIADVNVAGATIMTTDKLEIEVTEKTTDDAATQPALTTTTIAADAEVTIDIDQVGSTVAGAGLKVLFIGYAT